MNWVMWHSQDLFSAGLETVHISIYFSALLTDSDIRECIDDILTLSSPSPIPAGTKKSASRT